LKRIHRKIARGEEERTRMNFPEQACALTCVGVGLKIPGNFQAALEGFVTTLGKTVTLIEISTRKKILC
jgi:hypothetical protein